MRWEKGPGFRVQGKIDGYRRQSTAIDSNRCGPANPPPHTPLAHHRAPPPPEPRTLPPVSGSALVITLGLLAALALLVFAFTFSARTERFAARNDRDRLTARQYVDLALVQAMESVNYFTQLQGSPASFDFWKAIYQDADTSFTRNTFASRSEGDNIDTAFFDNFSTNLIPASLWDEIGELRPHWVPISQLDNSPDTQSGSGTGGNVVGTNGFIAYAVINCSGLLDAHYATSNQLWQLQADNADIDDLDKFLQDRARDTAPGSILTNYLSLHDLVLRNSGLLPQQPHNLFPWSYDPGPDVTVTNGAVYSNRDVQLVPKLDVNSWTNDLNLTPSDRSDLSDTSNLSTLSERLAEYYRDNNTYFRNTWLHEVTNRFAAIGFAAPEALAWNLVNFMDPDRIPQGPDGHLSWQEPWPVEDVPLINEIAVGMVPLEMSDDQPNHYAPGIELWYPFATNSITENDQAQLVVAVYTNWVPNQLAHTDANDTWIDSIIYPEERYGFTFSNRIEQMAQGTDTEFLTFTLPPPYVSFPVSVTRAVTAPVENTTEYKPETGSDATRLIGYNEPSDNDTSQPPRYYLTTTNLFLPLGIITYSTYLPEPPFNPTVWVKTMITVTNEIHLLARVKLGEHWVDEAAGYHPGYRGDGSDARTNLLVFTEPCGYEVDDPRRNGYWEDWRRYLPADRATPVWSEGEELPVCSLNGSTNVICNPWHLPYGQGLPLVHFNEPLRRSGDIGYIQLPESYPNHIERLRTITNLWQSICLADPTLLATNQSGFAFAAGSALEFFTARTTNTPVRGLVHFSTTHTNVVRALMADLPIGWGANLANLLPGGIDWMQKVFFSAQDELYGSHSTPIGVGDLCWGIGQVPEFQTIPPEDTDGDDTLRWQNSLGSDTKEDLLRGLAEHISFRQHVFVLCLAGKTVAPSGRQSSIQRAVAIVLRDAYTGRWQVVSWEWL